MNRMTKHTNESNIRAIALEGSHAHILNLPLENIILGIIIIILGLLGLSVLVG